MENQAEVSETSLEVTIYKSLVSEITIYRSLMSESGKGMGVHVSGKYWKVHKESQRVLDVFKWIT